MHTKVPTIKRPHRETILGSTRGGRRGSSLAQCDQPATPRLARQSPSADARKHNFWAGYPHALWPPYHRLILHHRTANWLLLHTSSYTAPSPRPTPWPDLRHVLPCLWPHSDRKISSSSFRTFSNTYITCKNI